MNNISNSVRLIGRLGMDPEIRHYPDDRKKARFNLATNETYKDGQGEKITQTVWHRLVVWGKQVDFVEKYLHKGKEIAVEGRLRNQSYLDKSGEKRYITEVVVNEIRFVGSPTETEA